MERDILYSQHLAQLQAGYEKVLAQVEYDAIAIHAGQGLKQRLVDDQYWPLKVNPSFGQWLPLQEAGALLLLKPGATPRLLRPPNASIWEGAPPVASDHFWEHFEVVECSREQMAAELPKGRLAFIGDSSEAAEALGIKAEHRNPKSLTSRLDALRVHKSAYEVACIAEANRIAAKGHSHLAQLFAEGQQSELGLHLAYLAQTSQDASDTPYKNIVALGTNAAVLHHVHYDRCLDAEPNQSMLVDAGVCHLGYASDITRTFVRGDNQGAKQFRALIAAMESLELALCDEIKPGLPYEELHNKAHERLATVLIESELCGGSAEELLAAGITRAFFPHGLGHSLGLQVHDVGCRLQAPRPQNAFLRNTSTIEAGQVFTIEPGCYFIEGLLGPVREGEHSKLVNWSTVEALRPFGGIRIEDNLQVGSSASTNLTRDNWPS